MSKRRTMEGIDPYDTDAVLAYLDGVMAEGLVQVRAESEMLRARGLIGPDGEFCGTELPADMREGSGGDCGVG